ncbi:IclR family transcriptional regulator [Nocardia aurantiaca]|uniref:Helix-turn-helix domain-containing protein n=1 Tax=Nocardia aurantiaca TaxID=2675850 RepID=A0A6I3L656_9NOCA|nr:IclR family transcriptional regulator [Nocardia aurantiaca]MTE16818.1 helix-turn-helix domain-containing protein [Nocardia aurantiaca]
MTENNRTQPSILVLEKCVRVLDCFTPDRPKLPISDIRKLTGLPSTTATRIVQTLVSSDLLQRDGDMYRLGLRVLAWTASATAGSELIAAAKPVVENLRDLTGESSGVYIRRGIARVAVAVELSRQSIIYQANVGQVMPVHAGSSGKVFMAFDPRALAAVLEQEAGGIPPATIANRVRLQEELAEIRERGWAYTQEEREKGLNSIAAPVYDHTGEIAATLSIGGPAFRLTPEAAREFGPLTAQFARGLSRRLGQPNDRSDIDDATTA